MGESFGDFMIGEATRKTQEINQLSAKLAASEQRNRELTARLEALQAHVSWLQSRLEVARCHYFDVNPHPENDVFKHMQFEQSRDDAIRTALTAPPSSAPSDDRADTP